MKKIGIVGTRRRAELLDYKAVEARFFEIYQKGDMIVSGGCPKGADAFAESIARKHGIPIIIYHPDWKRNGRAAGFVRNTTIAEESDILIACVAENRTGGTEDTIKKFLKLKSKEKLYVVR